ncbi:hypothetical protein CIK52_00055 [Kocuria rosea]|uniref:DUF305 domain-containing protein n=1 Tax=Kocuria rosea TaxID=1275 RepID=UPI000D6557C2|nr:DUF305 domain-containing protein [Kocuria rosea]PWF87757.1 hypothetical protein CIK52_00055 [Kocuria rosea]QCY32896.1 DUF305 domain-containing protein [Kocuria rosea]TQN33729.1 uncharacterized protein (DUF305 family) [Kocuria rosea]
MTSTFKHLAAGTVLALALSGAGATAAVASPTHQPASASAQTGAERHMNHDRHFAVMMVPHHQGATDMAELALQKSERPEIRDLAEKIIEAQTEEIQQLEAAAQRLTAENTSGHHHHGHGHRHGHHGHGGHGQSMNADMQGAMMDEMDEMDGMDGMSLEELAKLSGDEFDQAFLEQMIAHHQMALEMAEMELQMGTDLELRAMAEKMIEDQQAEIELMQGWLEEWFAA